VAQEMKQESEGNTVDRVKVRARNGKDNSSRLGYPSKKSSNVASSRAFQSRNDS